MRYCECCGAQRSDTARFCPKCGRATDDALFDSQKDVQCRQVGTSIERGKKQPFLKIKNSVLIMIACILLLLFLIGAGFNYFAKKNEEKSYGVKIMNAFGTANLLYFRGDKAVSSYYLSRPGRAPIERSITELKKVKDTIEQEEAPTQDIVKLKNQFINTVNIYIECLTELTYSSGRRDVWQVARKSAAETQSIILDFFGIEDVEIKKNGIGKITLGMKRSDVFAVFPNQQFIIGQPVLDIDTSGSSKTPAAMITPARTELIWFSPIHSLTIYFDKQQDRVVGIKSLDPFVTIKGKQIVGIKLSEGEKYGYKILKEQYMGPVKRTADIQQKTSSALLAIDNINIVAFHTDDAEKKIVAVMIADDISKIREY